MHRGEAIRGERALHRAVVLVAEAAPVAWEAVAEHRAATCRAAFRDAVEASRPEWIAAADLGRRGELDLGRDEAAPLRRAWVAEVRRLVPPLEFESVSQALPGRAPLAVHWPHRALPLWPFPPVWHQYDCRDAHSATPL